MASAAETILTLRLEVLHLRRRLKREVAAALKLEQFWRLRALHGPPKRYAPGGSKRRLTQTPREER